MRFNKAGCAAGLAVAMWCGFAADSAPGAVVVDSRFSTSSADAFVTGLFGGTASDNDTRSSTDNNPFSYNAQALAEVAGGEAGANAEHNSSLAFANGSFSGATMMGYSDAHTVANAEADATGLSSLFIEFTVPQGETYDFTMSGNLEKSDNSRASAEIYLYDVVRDQDLVYRNGNTGAFNLSGQLLPGEYELSARSRAFASDVSGQFEVFSDISMNFAIAAVPEPASLALLAAPAALLLRRRRHG
jgi:hypothetical protein